MVNTKISRLVKYFCSYSKIGNLNVDKISVEVASDI